MKVAIDYDWIEERVLWVWSQSELDATGFAQNGSFIVPLGELAPSCLVDDVASSSQFRSANPQYTSSVEIEEILDLTYGRAAQYLSDEYQIHLPLRGLREDQSLAGFIHADPQATIILVKRGANVARHHVARRRFTVAHELGHFVLHFCPLWEKAGAEENLVLVEGIHAPNDEKIADETQFSSDLSLARSPKNYAQLEAEANAFAARLLMPEFAVRSLFNKWAPRLSPRRSVLARRFCGEFLVSAPAMRRRLDDLDLGVADRDTSWS